MGAAGFLVLALLIYGIVTFSGVGLPTRISAMIVGDPMTIWSCSTKDDTCAVISAPPSYVVDAIHGYGHYSLASLFQLGIIDKRNGALVAESLGDTVGIITPWYIDTGRTSLTKIANPVKFGRSMFSWGSVVSFLFHPFDTNMPISVFIAFVRELMRIPINQISPIDLSAVPVASEVTEPDGTKEEVIDPAQVDLSLHNVVEDEDVRREGTTVAIYNTTQTPGLGNRAARFLSAGGALVVSVANENTELSGCTLTGSKSALSTKTAAFAHELFHCKAVQTTQSARADLSLRLGDDFASRYEPLNH